MQFVLVDYKAAMQALDVPTIDELQAYVNQLTVCLGIPIPPASTTCGLWEASRLRR